MGSGATAARSARRTRSHPLGTGAPGGTSKPPSVAPDGNGSAGERAAACAGRVLLAHELLVGGRGGLGRRHSGHQRQVIGGRLLVGAERGSNPHGEHAAEQQHCGQHDQSLQKLSCGKGPTWLSIIPAGLADSRGSCGGQAAGRCRPGLASRLRLTRSAQQFPHAQRCATKRPRVLLAVDGLLAREPARVA
jgi:hypothetical protein